MNISQSSSPTNHRPPDRGWWGRWFIRAPVKCALFLLVTLFVCFPYPTQLIRNLGRIRNLQSMIEPDAPELAAWDEELGLRVQKAALAAATSQPESAKPSAAIVQREVQLFVLEKVKYEWDWNLWGSADYMPTVHEMFELAARNNGQLREDCDGRAVMAASLMKRLGFAPTLVTDLRHVWVTTPQGEWMGPGGAKTIVSTTQGTHVNWSTAAGNFGISLSYGIAVFPLVRELVILFTLFLLLLRRDSRLWPAAAGLLLLVQGLLFMRLGFLAPGAVSREVSAWPTWIGLIHVASAIVVLAVVSRRHKVNQRISTSVDW